MDTGTEPTGMKDRGTEPAEPTGTEPTGTEPTGTEPTGTEPMAEERTGTEPRGTEPTRPEPQRGPAVWPILLGLLVLATAAFALADQTLDLSVNWGRVGPVGILVGGGVLVLLGLLGMRRRQR